MDEFETSVENRLTSQESLVEIKKEDCDITICTNSTHKKFVKKLSNKVQKRNLKKKKKNKIKVKKDSTSYNVALKQLLDLDKRKLKYGLGSKYRPKFECYRCEQTFNERKEFNEHLSEHIKNDSFKLDYCDKLDTSNEKEKDDYKRMRFPKKFFTCFVCPAKFRLRTELDSHLKSHAKQMLSLTCKVCYQVFKSKSALQDHYCSPDSEDPVYLEKFTSPSRFEIPSSALTLDNPFYGHDNYEIGCNEISHSEALNDHNIGHKTTLDPTLVANTLFTETNFKPSLTDLSVEYSHSRDVNYHNTNHETTLDPTSVGHSLFTETDFKPSLTDFSLECSYSKALSGHNISHETTLGSASVGHTLFSETEIISNSTDISAECSYSKASSDHNISHETTLDPVLEEHTLFTETELESSSTDSSECFLSDALNVHNVSHVTTLDPILEEHTHFTQTEFSWTDLSSECSLCLTVPPSYSNLIFL